MTKISANLHSMIDSAASPQTALSANEDLSLQTLLARILTLAFFAFLGGFLLTTVATTVRGYQRLPNAGEIVKYKDGSEAFQADYPDFRVFAISTPDSPHGTAESKFSKVGVLGTGLYVYGISNALHWIMELKIRNFQALLLIPLAAIFTGVVLLFRRMPPALRTRDRIFNYTVLLALFHSLFVVSALVLAMVLSENFRSLIDQPFLYVGQILGILIPSTFIIIFTNLFYGAVAGGILSWLAGEE